MFKINNRSNRHCAGVFIIINFEYIWHVSSLFFFFAEFEHVNAGWNILLPSSKYMFSRVISGNPVTFKAKFSVATVNNSF